MYRLGLRMKCLVLAVEVIIRTLYIQEMNVTSCLVNLTLAVGLVRLAWLHLQETVALGYYI